MAPLSRRQKSCRLDSQEWKSPPQGPELSKDFLSSETLLGTGASLVVTGALLVVTRTLLVTRALLLGARTLLGAPGNKLPQFGSSKTT